MGESGIQTASLEKLAKAMAAGNKAALFFNELCDEDSQRKGVSISRFAEVWLKVGAKLKDKNYATYLDKKLYDAAMKEWTDLEASMKVLMGKGISMDDETTESVGRIAYGSMSSENKTPAEVDGAAKKVILCD